MKEESHAARLQDEPLQCRELSLDRAYLLDLAESSYYIPIAAKHIVFACHYKAQGHAYVHAFPEATFATLLLDKRDSSHAKTSPAASKLVGHLETQGSQHGAGAIALYYLKTIGSGRASTESLVERFMKEFPETYRRCMNLVVLPEPKVAFANAISRVPLEADQEQKNWLLLQQGSFQKFSDAGFKAHRRSRANQIEFFDIGQSGWNPDELVAR